MGSMTMTITAFADQLDRLCETIDQNRRSGDWLLVAYDRGWLDCLRLMASDVAAEDRRHALSMAGRHYVCAMQAMTRERAA